MKGSMKRLALLMAAFTIADCGQAEDSSAGAKWTTTVKVVDESNQPVAWADVTIGYYVPAPADQTIASDSTKGKTDTSGFYSASGRTRSTDLFFGAGKEGYYHSHLEHAFHKFKDSDPTKRSPNIALLLKKIKRPIPMYAKRMISQPPIQGAPVGYDLEVGDWVTPHGKGSRTDILFATFLDKRADDDWDYKVVVSFPNPGDGIQPFTISDLERTSSLRSPHEAPEGGYQLEWIKTQSQRPGQPGKYGINDDLNFFFRVRTVLDEYGNVKTANYGKIYGDFLNFQYFFNGTANSRNVEFDPTKNLMEHLQPGEHVELP